MDSRTNRTIFRKNNGTHITKGYKFEFRYFPTEREMLEDFIDFITPITAMSGWNFLGFDWLYIYNRCKINNIDIERISPTRTFTNFKITPRAGGKTINVKVPMHKIIYDYLLVYKTWDMTIQPKENNTLDFVAEKALGIKKLITHGDSKNSMKNISKNMYFIIASIQY